MNIVVIGSGWLGLPLAAHLHQQGHAVTATRRSASLPDATGFPVVQFSPATGPFEIVQQADVVIFAFPPDRSAFEAYANDCLHIAAHTTADCHILLISSTSVYPSTVLLADESAADNADPSRNAILFAERSLKEQVGNRLTILRLAGLIGPGRYPVSAMSKSGKTYNGLDPVNVIHLDDAVGLSTFLVENNFRGETVNGCSGNHPSKKDYYSWMAEQLGIHPPSFEPGGNGKTILSEKSREMGYRYRRDDPYNFLD